MDFPLELDPARYLDSDEAISEYLRQTLEDGDASVLTPALKDAVWALAVSRLAQEINLPRSAVFRQLAGDEPLTTEMLFKVLKALGFKLSVSATKS